MFLKSREVVHKGRAAGRISHGLPSVFCSGLLDNDAQMVKVVVDGAWQKESCNGVAAWHVEGSMQCEPTQGYTRVHALSSTGACGGFGHFCRL